MVDNLNLTTVVGIFHPVIQCISYISQNLLPVKYYPLAAFFFFFLVAPLFLWLQQNMNRELRDVQAGFRKSRGTRDQIANSHWIIKKAREFQKNIYFCFIDYSKAFDGVDHNKLENSSRDGNSRPLHLPLEKPVCRSGSHS